MGYLGSSKNAKLAIFTWLVAAVAAVAGCDSEYQDDFDSERAGEVNENIPGIPAEFLAPENDIDVCTLDARASALVSPVLDGGDVWYPFATDNLWFEYEGAILPAQCAVRDNQARCILWLTGYELAGPFTAHMVACGVESTVSYEVEMDDEGCHVVTEYISLLVDTRGCLTAPVPGSMPLPSDVDAPAPADPDLTGIISAAEYGKPDLSGISVAEYDLRGSISIAQSNQ